MGNNSAFVIAPDALKEMREINLIVESDGQLPVLEITRRVAEIDF